MLENLILLIFDLLYLGSIVLIGIIATLLIQGLVYQLSNKKINLYKKIINSEFLWR